LLPDQHRDQRAAVGQLRPVAFLAAPKSKIQFNGVGGLRTYISFTHSAFQVNLSGSFHMSNTSVDTGMTNDYEQPVNWARIVVLVAVALPGFWRLVLRF
jgi:hypothetical protein